MTRTTQRIGTDASRRDEAVFTNRGNRRRAATGLTLIETALATIIVGVGVLAMMVAQQAFHHQNAWSSHAGTAMRLANEIREMTLNLPRHDPVTKDAFWGPEDNESWLGDYDDLDDFDGNGGGLIFSSGLDNGPINARREVIADMDGWAQVITVESVDPMEIYTVADDGTTDMVRVEVVITFQGPSDAEPEEITRMSWVSPR